MLWNVLLDVINVVFLNTKILCVMCERKDYNGNVSRYLENIVCRIVYASFPDFIARYVAYFKEEFPDVSFRERVLTQVEEQILDVDTVASILNITLEDVLKEKVYVLNSRIEGFDFTVFIGRQYLAIILSVQGKSISEECLAALAKMLNTQSIKDNIEIVNFNCKASHSMAAQTEDELKEILDINVFKGIEADIKNSRYIDSYLRGEYYIELTRELRDILFDNQTSGVYANVLCSLNAKNKDIYTLDDIKNYLDILKEETTQCFI